MSIKSKRLLFLLSLPFIAIFFVSLPVRLSSYRDIRLLLSALPPLPNIKIPCIDRAPTPTLISPSLPPLPTAFLHKLTSYTAFHATARRCLQTNPASQCPPTLIWTCPTSYCAGIGDRFKGIVTSLLLAIASDRVFLIDWTEPSSLQTALLPAAIDWTLPPRLAARRIVGKPLITLDLPRLPWFICGRYKPCRGFMAGPIQTALPIEPMPSMETKELYVGRRIDITKDDFTELTKHIPDLVIESRIPFSLSKFRTNKHLNESLFHSSTPPLEVNVLRALLRLLFTPSQKVSALLKQSQDMLGTPYDAVHARLGSDVGEGELDRFAGPNAHLNKTAGQLLACLHSIGGGNRPVYLATDSMPFKKLFAEVASGMGLTVVASGQRAQHVGKVGTSGEVMCAGFRDAFVDLLALANAKAVVGSRSGFSDLAVIFGGVEAYTHTLLREGGRCYAKSTYRLI